MTQLRPRDRHVQDDADVAGVLQVDLTVQVTGVGVVRREFVGAGSGDGAVRLPSSWLRRSAARSTSTVELAPPRRLEAARPVGDVSGGRVLMANCRGGRRGIIDHE